MSEMLGNIVVSCPVCFAGGLPYVDRYVWYRNQYGGKVRIFCYRCGTVSEKKDVKGFVTSTIATWTVPIKYPRTPQEELPF